MWVTRQLPPVGALILVPLPIVKIWFMATCFLFFKWIYSSATKTSCTVFRSESFLEMHKQLLQARDGLSLPCWHLSWFVGRGLPHLPVCITQKSKVKASPSGFVKPMALCDCILYSKLSVVFLPFWKVVSSFLRNFEDNNCLSPAQMQWWGKYFYLSI